MVWFSVAVGTSISDWSRLANLLTRSAGADKALVSGFHLLKAELKYMRLKPGLSAILRAQRSGLLQNSREKIERDVAAGYHRTHSLTS